MSDPVIILGSKRPIHDDKPVLFGKINLTDRTKVLVKIAFTDHRILPPGLREEVRGSDYDQGAKQQEAHLEAIANDQIPVEDAVLAKAGRVREGMVDTGVRAFYLKNARATILTAGLRECGMILTDVHFYKHVREGRKTKFTIVLAYEWQGQPFELAPATAEGLNRLRNNSVWCAHGWKNPDGSATVNFVNQNREGRADEVVYVKDRVVVAESMTD